MNERPRPTTRDELLEMRRQLRKAIASMRRGQVIGFSAYIARLLERLVTADEEVTRLIDEARE